MAVSKPTKKKLQLKKNLLNKNIFKIPYKLLWVVSLLIKLTLSPIIRFNNYLKKYFLSLT